MGKSQNLGTLFAVVFLIHRCFLSIWYFLIHGVLRYTDTDRDKLPIRLCLEDGTVFGMGLASILTQGLWLQYQPNLPLNSAAMSVCGLRSV